MKKIFTVFIAFLFITHFFYAQEEEESYKADPFERAYSPGNVYFNAGVNFLFRNYSPSVFNFWNNYNYRTTLPVLASLEVGINEYLSFGGYIGFHSYGWDYRTSVGSYDYAYRRFGYGVRGSFHYLYLINDLLDLELDEKHIDLYATIMIGLNTRSETRKEPGLTTTDVRTNGSFGTLLGFRYMFNNTFGAYLEGGRGSLGFANIGLTLKF